MQGLGGWQSTIGATERRIPVERILAIQIKGASPLSNGSIRFVVAGERTGAPSGENALVFAYRQQAAFDELADAVASAIADHRGTAVAV